MPVTARVILHLKRIPERYKLVDQLIDVLDMKEETRTGTITALWHYIKVNGLQDKVDRRIIRPDAKLRPVSIRWEYCGHVLTVHLGRYLEWTKSHFISCQIL